MSRCLARSRTGSLCLAPHPTVASVLHAKKPNQGSWRTRCKTRIKYAAERGIVIIFYICWIISKMLDVSEQGGGKWKHDLKLMATCRFMEWIRSTTSLDVFLGRNGSKDLLPRLCFGSDHIGFPWQSLHCIALQLQLHLYLLVVRRFGSSSHLSLCQ